MISGVGFVSHAMCSALVTIVLGIVAVRPTIFGGFIAPDVVREVPAAEYCWTHGHNTRHNSNECTAQCVGHKTNATTHVNTGGNPKN